MSAIALHIVLAEAESQSGTSLIIGTSSGGMITLSTQIEQVSLIHAHTRIGKLYIQCVILLPCLDGKASTRRGEFDGIGQQILYHYFQRTDIRLGQMVDMEILGHHQVLVPKHITEEQEHLIGQSLQIDISHMPVYPLTARTGPIEQVLHLILQRGSRRIHLTNHLRLFLFRHLALMFHQVLQRSHYSKHRVLEVMGNDGNESVLIRKGHPQLLRALVHLHLQFVTHTYQILQTAPHHKDRTTNQQQRQGQTEPPRLPPRRQNVDVQLNGFL